MRKLCRIWFPTLLVSLASIAASAQSFRVQCPTSTVTHPVAANNNSEPAYVGPTYTGTSGYPSAAAHVNGAIKCQQMSGGAGYATMGEGTLRDMFSFGPLSGLADIANGLPGTESPSTFNTMPSAPLAPGDPATTDGIAANTWPGFPLSTAGFNYNGAIGLANNVPYLATIYDISEGVTPTTTNNPPGPYPPNYP